MKISYISGTKGRATVSQGNSTMIGSTDWADRVGIKLSTGNLTEIKLNQFNPLISTARGIIRELISGNRGGIADMLYGMSAFNTKGKIDSNLENQFNAAMKEAQALANQKYPLTYKKINWGNMTAFVPNAGTTDLELVKDDNWRKNLQYMQAAEKEIFKKFPYRIYPASNNEARNKYRSLEIKWLMLGGNVDSFNAAVKEGITKSPRNKTFNYLLGKFAAGTYRTKDLGLAIRAVVGAALGGDRFSWTDKDIFNPWIKRFGSGNIGGISADPATTTVATTAAATASAPWWVSFLTTVTLALIAALPLIISASKDENTPSVVDGSSTPSPGPGPGPSPGFGETDLMQYALPIGAALAAYLLLFKDDK